MPTYEYKCSKCQKNFELIQKISDPPAQECPNCGGKVKRLIFASPFALKGSGWYKDGYSSSSVSEKKPAKKENTKETKKEIKKDGTQSPKK